LSRASAGAQMKSTSSTTRNIYDFSNAGSCSAWRNDPLKIVTLKTTTLA
jgi:hypothetical protein